MSKRREHDDDDGRTVADMSGIEGRASFIGSIVGLRGDRKRRREITDDQPTEGEGEKRALSLTREERRWYIFGALGAAMLIFLAFAVGLGIIIALMVLFWR